MTQGANDPWLRQRAWSLSCEELERRSRRWYDQVWRIFEAGKAVSVTQLSQSGLGVGAALAKDKRSERLACLEFALADVVDAFTAEEREQLHQHDALPPDFIDRVGRRAKAVDKQLRW